MDVQAVRHRLGLRQREFAELLGAHPMTVSRWERGVSQPGEHQLRLLQAFAAAAERGASFAPEPAQAHAPKAKGRRSPIPTARRDPVRFLAALLDRAYRDPELDLGALSATNRFAGRIVELQRGDVMSKVVIEIAPQIRIGSVITTDSVDRLGLVSGARAVAIIKATEVIVGKP